MKTQLTSASVLALPDGSDGFVVYYDASRVGLGYVLMQHGSSCVPGVDDIRQRILTKVHGVRYSIHPGATNMYRNLCEIYWWSGMKRDIAEFLAKFSTCQQVKMEHQKPNGPMQEFSIPT
ncbi:hypothetical protein T459_30359 [Capsicum annuum]|uniref:Integrase zinc-binding domain-containing protein n=1 Tax=Capsicum annuum TaxID=4072 RepID=A0A2G2Y882_CAPAN|nr:hypothetical protein T459_30359 [Capsicum annuum]